MNHENLNEKVSQKADEFLKCFKKIHRHHNQNEEIYILEDNTPNELKELIREAHGDFFPDDFRYETIHDALCAFADCDPDQDLYEIQLEPDIYNHDLLKWLSSNLRRASYCDEVISEFGLEKIGTMTLIAYGQQMEKDEVVNSIREYLISLCEEGKEGS